MMSKLSLVVIYLYGTICLSVQENKINDNLINSLIEPFLSLKNNVPKYKLAELVTPVSHRSKRELRPIEFKFDDETIRLNLTPLKRNVMIRDLPVWTVETDSNTESGHIYAKQDKSAFSFDGSFYEDFNNKAILFASYRNERIYYDGVCGEGSKRKIIRSLPEQYINSEMAGSNDHIIFEASETNVMNIKNLEGTYDWEIYKKLARPLDVLYPKILIVVESNYFNNFNRSIQETMMYLSIFWNVVGQKYSEIPYPQVKLMVTGVVIAKDDTALQFLYESRTENNMGIIDLPKFMIGGNNYFEFIFGDEVSYKNYDSTVFMTDLKVPRIAGQSLALTICLKYILYVFDDGNYFGTIVAAHELGHTMGMTDDYLANSHLYHNSSVLFPIVLEKEKYFWSQRSLTELKEFAKIERAACLENMYRKK